MQTLHEMVREQAVKVATYLGDAPFPERRRHLLDLCNMAGLELPDTRLPPGTALLDVGVEAQRKLKRDVDAMAPALHALAGLSTRLHVEQHQDIDNVPSRGLRLSPTDGGMFNSFKPRALPSGETSPEVKGSPYTASAFSHAAALIKPADIRNGFAENMLALPSKLRAEVFNHWAEKTSDDKRVAVRTVWLPEEGRRIIRAVTSDKHSLSSGDDSAIIQALTPHGVMLDLVANAKARIQRGWDKTVFEFIWPAMDRELVVGDIAYCFVRIRNSETKAGALTVEAGVLQVLCYNFTTAESIDLDAQVLRARHVGDLRRRIGNMIQLAFQRIDPLVKAFGDAYRHSTNLSEGEVWERAQRQYGLRQCDVEAAKAEFPTQRALRNRYGEPTLADFMNALTGAARNLPDTHASVLESAAGQMAMRGWGV